MLPELIKLSKELFEMDLIKESIEIDNLIHKLHGLGSSASITEPPLDTVYSEGSGSSLDDVKDIIISNSNNEFFKAELASVLADSLELEELENIKNALSDYLE
jgi:hypothetical protein